MSKDSDVLFGADPEVFASYFIGEKMYVMPPAYFRKYTDTAWKKNGRHPLFIATKDHIVHEDGVAFEVGLKPKNSFRELLSNIHAIYQEIEEKILPLCSEVNRKLAVIPTINYEVDRWLKISETDPSFAECLIFGCDPDYDAFELEVEPVEDVAHHPFRYGGGHFHFSGLPLFRENPNLSARLCAMTLGLCATAFSPVPELEKLRTFRYGRPGKFRPQHYPDGSFGVEYRTPSNSWTNPSHKDLANMMEKWVEIAVRNVLPGSEKFESMFEKNRMEIAKAIKEADQPLASSLLDMVEEAI